MIYGVTTDVEIPAIWGEMAVLSTKQIVLANMVQHLMSGMAISRRHYLSHSDLLYCSVLMYNFVAGDRFVNPGESTACPAGDMAMWTTLQDKGGIEKRMASADTDLSPVNGRNAMADQLHGL